MYFLKVNFCQVCPHLLNSFILSRRVSYWPPLLMRLLRQTDICQFPAVTMPSILSPFYHCSVLPPSPHPPLSLSSDNLSRLNRSGCNIHVEPAKIAPQTLFAAELWKRQEAIIDQYGTQPFLEMGETWQMRRKVVMKQTHFKESQSKLRVYYTFQLARVICLFSCC